MERVLAGPDATGAETGDRDWQVIALRIRERIGRTVMEEAQAG